MSYEIHADYEQRFLLPPDLEEWVPTGHPARFIREFVDSLDLQTLGFKFRESDDGRPNYSSQVLLKVWLYGYMNRIRSTRQLERMCLNDIGMLWLTGMNYPDHNTIWRFFRDNKSALKEVFRQTVRIVAQMELVELVLNAVDGTKILKELDDDVLEEVCDEIERNEQDEKGREYRLPENLQDRDELREEIEKQLKKLNDSGTKEPI